MIHPKTNLVVLLSGRGSNLQAILTAIQTGLLSAKISLVVSNNPTALGLSIATTHHIPTVVINHQEFSSREQFEQELIHVITPLSPDYIVLAGFMRVLSPLFVTTFSGQIVNIHPSLLPKFKGLHTHRRALESGERLHGATTHFVTEELDGGPLIVQATLTVLANSSEQQLAEQVLQLEHQLYPVTLKLLSEGRITYLGGSVWFDGQQLTDPLQLSAVYPLEV